MSKIKIHLSTLFIVFSIGVFAQGNSFKNEKTKATYLNLFSETIQTKSGKVSGYNEGGINIFKGIPFAAAPVGALRWKAPQPVKAWSGVLECKKFGPSPIQNEPIPFMCWSTEFLIPKEPISEDCLYLNVWSKEKSNKKPVLVYIYGGGFRSGGAGCPIYDGKAMAEKDIVFVSINYRVGVFGFLAHPELTKESNYKASGNYALLDMIAALKWVKENIASFGGDPDKVTIAGQSAGAFAVSHLCATPLAKGLFVGAIAESGGSILPSSLRPNLGLEEAEKIGMEFAKKLNAVSIEELRNKSAEEILKSAGGLSSPIEDGYVLPSSIAEIYTRGKQNDVAILLGWNADDYIMGKPLSGREFKDQLEKQYGAKSIELMKFYPITNEAISIESQKAFSRDQSFGVQGYAWAHAQKNTGKSKVFVYNFNRKLPAYNIETEFGAFHSSEIVYAYNNLSTLDRPWKETDKFIASQMSSYWANFIKTRNPNGTGLVNWPIFESREENILILDEKIEAKKLPSKEQLLFIASLFKK